MRKLPCKEAHLLASVCKDNRCDASETASRVDVCFIQLHHLAVRHSLKPTDLTCMHGSASTSWVLQVCHPGAKSLTASWLRREEADGSPALAD